MLTYIPGGVAPDAIFMKGETSSTITQVTLITVDGTVLAQTTATAINQLGAAAIANTAGATYTTTAGFVLAGNGAAFRTFQLAFASATTHFVGYIQSAGGEDTMIQSAPGATPAPAAVSKKGTVTDSGKVASVQTGGLATGFGGALTKNLAQGAAGSIISRRK